MNRRFECRIRKVLNIHHRLNPRPERIRFHWCYHSTRMGRIIFGIPTCISTVRDLSNKKHRIKKSKQQQNTKKKLTFDTCSKCGIEHRLVDWIGRLVPFSKYELNQKNECKREASMQEHIFHECLSWYLISFFSSSSSSDKIHFVVEMICLK